ncbi:hypothetical protein GOODEAATRI_019696 [Goodea atripinnis]|uniref:Uncharacterized protein n=1 Tax=Goodea atripinnis TaxID=208336 RepID=A0ABV0PZE4_9TELE
MEKTFLGSRLRLAQLGYRPGRHGFSSRWRCRCCQKSPLPEVPAGAFNLLTEARAKAFPGLRVQTGGSSSLLEGLVDTIPLHLTSLTSLPASSCPPSPMAQFSTRRLQPRIPTHAPPFLQYTLVVTS